MEIKIEISVLNLSKQKPTEVRKCELCLHDTWGEYEVDFFGNEPLDDEDELLGWSDEKHFYQKTFFKKNSVSSYNLYYSNKEEKWTLYISIIGAGEDVPIWFEDRKVADGVYDKLKEWLCS